jgi:Asp-tRNA(Asn)/Glu-tRNA(Gln) amidotransferase A subunit family amidase
MDATSILQDINLGKTTIENLVADAVNKINEAQPRLNAATEILTDAQQQLDNIPDGPLKGLPISIKECYAMQGRQIRSGSVRMKPIDCKEDAAVVKKLKAAGVIVVARGNTSEFLLGRETDNLVYGTTNNAINSKLTAGGSSGGDAAMVATNCVAFGIGTDIGGSCRYPAVFNGIVGFKPASGQIDKTGIFPSAPNAFVESMNSPGILCCSVRDVRLVYNVISNKQLNEQSNVNFQLLTSAGFRVKIKEDSIRTALNASVDFLKTISSSVKDLDISDSGKHYVDFATLMTGGFTDKIYEWSETADGKKLSYIGELLRRIKGKPTLSNELFAMLLPFLLIKPSPAKQQKTVQKAKAAREKYQAMLGNGILVLPTMGILAPQHRKFVPQYNKPGVIDIITPVSFCNIYNLSCITLPAWKYQTDKTKNPPGIQLVCAPGNEELLLNVAEQLEMQLK